jgi:hypothetical protein
MDLMMCHADWKSGRINSSQRTNWMSGETRVKRQWPSNGPVSSAEQVGERQKNAVFSFLPVTLPSKNTLLRDQIIFTLFSLFLRIPVSPLRQR